MNEVGVRALASALSINGSQNLMSHSFGSEVRFWVRNPVLGPKHGLGSEIRPCEVRNLLTVLSPKSGRKLGGGVPGPASGTALRSAR